MGDRQPGVCWSLHKKFRFPDKSRGPGVIPWNIPVLGALIRKLFPVLGRVLKRDCVVSPQFLRPGQHPPFPRRFQPGGLGEKPVRLLRDQAEGSGFRVGQVRPRQNTAPCPGGANVARRLSELA